MGDIRVLVVEDNKNTLELLCEQLDDARFELLTAGDGQDAILRVGERAPHVVIMDVMMPHLDGFETARYLKLRFRDHFTPILMLTAKSDAASREEGARYGCEDYRSKPYTRKQLLASVELLIELGALENTLLEAESVTLPLAEKVDEEGSSEPAIPVHSEESLIKARRRTVALRLDLARRQLEELSLGIARAHVERVLDLSPGHEGAAELLSRIEAGFGEL